MFRFLGKLVRAIDRRIGVGREWTYLYKIAKQDGWSASMDGCELTWELLEPPHVDRLTVIGPCAVSEGLERLRRGNQCYTVCIDGRMAHYSWVRRSGFHPIVEAATSVPVAEGEFWIYDCWTADWARGKGIYPATLVRIVHDHFDAGYSTACIYTSRKNIASQRGILRSGFGLVATMSALRVGRRYYRLGRENRGT